MPLLKRYDQILASTHSWGDLLFSRSFAPFSGDCRQGLIWWHGYVRHFGLSINTLISHPKDSHIHVQSHGA